MVAFFCIFSDQPEENVYTDVESLVNGTGTCQAAVSGEINPGQTCCFEASDDIRASQQVSGQAGPSQVAVIENAGPGSANPGWETVGNEESGVKEQSETGQKKSINFWRRDRDFRNF